MTTDQKEALYWSLEAERWDITYRKPLPPRGLTELLPIEQQEIWFHAGRYDAGARDKDAMRGHAKAMKLARQR